MTGPMIMMPTVNVPPPAPVASSGSQSTSQSSSGNTQQQNQQVQNQAPSSQQNDNSQQSNNQQTGQASSANHSNASSDNNNGSNNSQSASNDNGSTKFSHVLAASQNQSNAQGTAGTQGQSQQGQASSDTSSADDASGSSADIGTTVVASNIISLLMTLQSQVQGAVATQGNSGDATGNTNASAVTTDQTTVSSQDNNLLQELQQLLQQLLQQASAQGQGTQTTDTASTQDASSAGNSNTSQQGTDNKDTDASLAELMSQLVSVLNQITQQPNAQSLASDLNSLTITSDTSGGQSATDILAQFAQSIQNSLNVAQNGNAASSAANNNAPATPGVFDRLVNALMNTANTGIGAGNSDAGAGKDTAAAASTLNTPVQDPKAQLESALSDIVSIFTAATQGSTPSASNGSASGNSKDSTDNNNSTNVNVNALAMPAANPQVTGTEFVKLTQAPTQHAPVTDQVLVQIQNAAKTGANTITIQLSPEDLGKVDVRMVTASDGTTNINITADNRATLAMLQSEAQSLQSALRDVGLKADMGSLSFNLSSQQQNTSNFNNNQGGYTKVASSVDAIDDDMNYGTTIASYQLSVQSGLNIMV